MDDSQTPKVIRRKKVIEVGKDYSGPSGSVPAKSHPYLMASKTADLAVLVRPAEAADIPFIFNSWLRSFRTGSLCANVANSIYFVEHHKVLEKLLKRSEVLVACEPSDPTNIYGYLCYEKIQDIFVLHYAYVKHTFRQLGVANSLLEKTGCDFTKQGLFSHHNKSSERFCAKLNLTYHPYIIMNYEPEKPVTDE